jgi:hypothetical protein
MNLLRLQSPGQLGVCSSMIVYQWRRAGVLDVPLFGQPRTRNSFSFSFTGHVIHASPLSAILGKLRE